MSLFGYAVRRALPALSAGRIGILLLGLATGLRAADLPAPVTLDLPIPVNRALPAWIGQPETPATTFGTLNLPLMMPDPNASLLVTAYFREKPGGFLRLIWKGTVGSQVLSDNFYENIGMANQRSQLISPDVLSGDGMLMFQSGDPKLGIQRIKLEWLASKTALVSPKIQDLLVTSASGQTRPAVDLNGAPPASATGAWDNQLVTVPMTDTPVRIEQGVDFSIDLDKVPGAARIALVEAGLPLGKRLVVWVNEERAGTMTPAVPDLLDEGYLTSEDKDSSGYVGWRAATFYPPVSLLKLGINTVQFSIEDDTNATSTTTSTSNAQDAPLAIKSLVMQLNYTPASAAVPVIAPQPIAAVTPPVENASLIVPLLTTPAEISPVPDLPLPQFLAPATPNLRAVSPETTP